MKKLPSALQFLQMLAWSAVACGPAYAQFPSTPNGRIFFPPVRLPAGDVDVATAALAGPDNKLAAYPSAPPQLNAPFTPSAPTAAAEFDPLAPPQIETPATGGDSWAPPLPPAKEGVTAAKPRLFERIRQRWTKKPSATAGRGNDPADQTPKLEVEVPGLENSIAAAPPAALPPEPTAKRGWFQPLFTGNAQRR